MNQLAGATMFQKIGLSMTRRSEGNALQKQGFAYRSRCAGAAVIAATASVLLMASPQARADDAPGAGPTVDVLKLMPPSTNVFVSINLDAGRQFTDSLKDTRLGKAMNPVMTPPHLNGAQGATWASMVSLFGTAHQVGIGMILPEHGQPSKTVMPEGIAIISGADPNQVRTLARAVAAGADWKWTDETVGQNVIHTATGPHPTTRMRHLPTMPTMPGMPGMPEIPLPSYSLVPGGVIIGSSTATVRNALQQMDATGAGTSFADSPELQMAAGSVDRTQFMWGVVTRTGMTRMSTLGATTTGANQIDLTKLPLMHQILESTQGSSFEMSLHRDRIELKSTAAYDANTNFGKRVRTFGGAPMKAPQMLFGHSLLFVDASDMTHLAAWTKDIMDQFTGPMFRSMMAPMAQMFGNRSGAQWMEPMMDMSGVLVNDLLGSMGNEVALAIGPVNPKTFYPSAALLIQKSDNPRLQHWIDDFMQLAGAASSNEWYPTTILNTQVQVLGTSKNPVRPAYAQIGDFHVIASDTGALKTPLYLSSGTNPDHALAANEQYQEMSKLWGENPMMVVYADLGGTAQSFETLAPLFSNQSRTKTPDMALGEELMHDVRAAGWSYLPDPSGLGERFELTFNPNGNGLAPAVGHGGGTAVASAK